MIIPPTTSLSTPPSGRTAELMRQARALESEFLSQMLGHASLGQTSKSFGGGIGEEQFASFLRDEQAHLMVQRGGIGLAERIFNALVERDHAK